MFVGGGIIPIRQGSDRLIHDVAKFLHGQKDIELTLAIKGEAYDGCENDYADICTHLVWIAPPGRWSVLGWFNKFCARCGVVVFEGVGVALGMRRQFMALAEKADAVVVNYLTWFPMLNSGVRRKKAVCVT